MVGHSKNTIGDRLEYSPLIQQFIRVESPMKVILMSYCCCWAIRLLPSQIFSALGVRGRY